MEASEVLTPLREARAETGLRTISLAPLDN